MIGGTSTIRIAYLILVHKNPAQVGRLLKRLYYPGCLFYIHVSASTTLTSFQEAAQGIPAEAIHFIQKRTRVRWGDFSVTTAILNGLVEVLNVKPEPDFIFLMSGQDYPLVSNDVLLSYLDTHSNRNFIQCDLISTPENEHLAERLNTYRIPLGPGRTITYPNKNPDSAKKRLLNQVLTYSRLLPISRPVPLNYTPYFGSNWFRIKPHAARYMLDFLRQHSAFIPYFRYVLVPEEYIFQTILANTPDTALRDSLHNDNFTYAHWDRPAELYSVPLDMSDAQALKSSGKFFARKFDETHNSTILDWLDQQAGISLKA